MEGDEMEDGEEREGRWRGKRWRMNGRRTTAMWAELPEQIVRVSTAQVLAMGVTSFFPLFFTQKGAKRDSQGRCGMASATELA
jgi:hypothetical protein